MADDVKVNVNGGWGCGSFLVMAYGVWLLSSIAYDLHQIVALLRAGLK